jgi:salicylate hydroxylase
MRVAVVGAGIGGLAAGLCLAGAGFSELTIYERSGSLGEVGAGIQISSGWVRPSGVSPSVLGPAT